MPTAIYTHPACERHEMGAWHPESPARLDAISTQLIRAQLDPFLQHREGNAASIEQIARVHSLDSIALVQQKVAQLQRDGGDYYPLDADTMLNPHSWDAALQAAGAAIAATDAVIAGELENAFCAVRPPGHHARPSEAMGFCIFNNIAVAVQHALEVHGLKRVAIVDFDVHHGNGTEEAIAGDDRVLMVSFFQHPFYPYSGARPCVEASNCINIPVPAMSGGDVVRQLVNESWLPALHGFEPEMIFISAGFDAHKEDDLGGMRLVEADYAWMTKQLMVVAKKYAKGRIVSCLEGGYNLSALGRSVAAHIKVLAELDE
ncbi:MAG: histone deacetylase family protein [Burkholderiales bacterium]|nr:histone deacetylase family protein [Burkholderiales bacterium]